MFLAEKKKAMDYLLIAVKNLSNKEIQLLRKRIQKQTQKLKLFNLLREEDELEFKHANLLEKMGYTAKPAGFYTLKNRLHEDLIDVRMDVEKNEVIVAKEKVQNLRGLVYSRDSVTLLRELRRLEKKCFELELYAELKEIYFCYMMIYRHDKKNLEKYRSLMKDADFKQQTMMRLEELFYTKLLDTQDLFYFKNSLHLNEAEDALKQVEQINRHLQSKSSEFLYLSAKLTLRLNYNVEPEESKQLFREIVHLHRIYHSSFLINRYPNCDIAIQSLLSKYYYLTNSKDQFENTQKYIMEKINTLSGFKMFECTIFYFIYISIISKSDTIDRLDLAGLIYPYTTENNVEYFSNRIKNYFYYLMALEAFYSNDPDKSSSHLLRSRKYFSDLDSNNCWVAVENILLNIYNYVLSNEHRLISSELALLTRVVARFNLEENYVRPIKEVIRTTRTCLSKNDFSDYASSLDRIRNQNLVLFRLVSFQ